LAIARLLSEMKRTVEVFVINHSDAESKDFTENLKRVKSFNSVKISSITKADEIKINSQKAFFIDALLGTGLNKPVDGLLADVIDLINDSGKSVISIDMPSGLFCHEAPKHKHLIKASITLTFQRPKLTFLFADYFKYVGNFEVLDIGLDEEFIEKQNCDYSILVKKDIEDLILPRKKFSHKGTYGHALLLAGSKGKIGAAVLAGKACLRSGAGLLTAHLPACGYEIMQGSLPEAMVSTDENSDFITSIPKNISFSAIGMGPGIGSEKETAQTLKLLIQNAPAPLVLDADALNILAENKTWISFLPNNTILTPHPKEFDRLAGTHTSDFERLDTARTFAQKHGIILILKGTHTAIVMPDRKVFFNSSGNAALAKGGSGDVLTGIILGLLSQGYSPESAALIAVFIHGYTADLFVKNNSELTMLAGDIIELLPKAFLL